MPDIIYKSVPFAVSKTKQEEINGEPVGVISGYASAFTIDQHGDIIARTAFDDTIAEHIQRDRQIKVKYQHSFIDIIGGIRADTAVIDEKGLFVTAHINLNVQRGKEVFSLAKQGVLQDMSVGISVNQEDWESIKVDGQRVTQINKLRLVEVSIVDEPANRDAQITNVKSASMFLDHGIARMDHMYDADAAVERIKKFTECKDATNKQYESAFLINKESDASSFDSCKYPFCDVVDGKLKAVPQAIFSLANKLKSDDIDETDDVIEKLKEHAQRYYMKMRIDNPFDKAYHYDLNSVKKLHTERCAEKFLKSLGLSVRASKHFISICKSNGNADKNRERDAQDCSQRDVVEKKNNVSHSEANELSKKIDAIQAVFNSMQK